MEDKYNTMSAPELAGEASFIRWVTKGEHDTEWSSWVKNNPSNELIVSEARQIVISLSSLTYPALDDKAKAALWQKINDTVSSTKHTPRRVIFKWTLAAAATLALVIWVNTRPAEKVIAEKGERKELVLPEQSSVIVNADSKVSYKEDFAKRNVKLDGEAFFKVSKGSQFNVITDQGKVTVLGTSFNVKSREDDFEVTCYTGKVSVTHRTASSTQILQAGEKAILTAGQWKMVNTDSTVFFPGWIEGKFSFDDQPLAVVLAEFSRQYDVQVQVSPGLEQLRYTGVFEKGDMKKALEVITWPLQLKAEQKENTIHITR